MFELNIIAMNWFQDFQIEDSIDQNTALHESTLDKEDYYRERCSIFKTKEQREN